MCLLNVKTQEEVEPYRVTRVRTRTRARSPSPRRSRQSTQRFSRTEIVRESRPQSSSYIVTAPAPKPIEYPMIPAPQPVPVFVQPPPPAPIVVPAPPPPPSHISSSHHGGHHFVEVSPRSSYSSSSPSRSEYITHEREYRRESRRDYSPAETSPRYETFRYVEGAQQDDDRYAQYDRRESRSQVRSRSREYHDHEPRGGYRETNTRIKITDRDGRKSREYRDY